MKNLMTRFVIGVLPLVLISPAMASLVNVTNSSEVTLNANDSLLFYISDPSSNNCHSYPTEIDMVIGSLPLGGPVESIPGTSGVYLSGWLFSATLDSADGSVSIPLTDPDAARLRLSAGLLLLTPGSVSGGSYNGPVDLLTADATLSSQEAAELFGNGDPIIDIHDIGNGITFGYPGSTITNDFSASLISDNGRESEGARVIQADCLRMSAAPEPGTLGLLLIGVGLIAGRVSLAHRKRQITQQRITGRNHLDLAG